MSQSQVLVIQLHTKHICILKITVKAHASLAESKFPSISLTLEIVGEQNHP